jgi:hypothetical protein
MIHQFVRNVEVSGNQMRLSSETKRFSTGFCSLRHKEKSATPRWADGMMAAFTDS